MKRVPRIFFNICINTEPFICPNELPIYHINPNACMGGCEHTYNLQTIYSAVQHLLTALIR